MYAQMKSRVDELMVVWLRDFPQVHKAVLPNGNQVAVKVQYLGLESAVAADLSTLSILADFAALVFPDSFEFGYLLLQAWYKLISLLCSAYLQCVHHFKP